MAGLLYFRPGSLTKSTPTELATLGLAFDHPPAQRECTGQGPSGGPGVTIADPVRLGSAPLGINLAEQTWKPVPVPDGEPPLWIGWYTDARPTPQELARDKQLDGARVELADGQSWLVPVVRCWEADDEGFSIALPRAVYRDANRQWMLGDVQPLYTAIWEAAGRYWDVLLEGARTADGERFEYDFPIFDFACDLLGLNYSLSPDDISALVLFTSDGVAQRVTTAAVDFGTFTSWLQKKSESAPAGTDSSPGAED